MGFEYDPEKSAENKCKHGVDFEEAQALWSAVIARRDDNVRSISVRRSRDEEVEIYESKDI